MIQLYMLSATNCSSCFSWSAVQFIFAINSYMWIYGKTIKHSHNTVIYGNMLAMNCTTMEFVHRLNIHLDHNHIWLHDSCIQFPSIGLHTRKNFLDLNEIKWNVYYSDSIVQIHCFLIKADGASDKLTNWIQLQRNVHNADWINKTTNVERYWKTMPMRTLNNRIAANEHLWT